MPNWLKKCWRLADGFVQWSAAWLALLVLLGAGAGAVALMSQVTGSITILASYGWGLPVLVAIGIVLAIIFFMSIAAIAWRYFRPLPLSHLPTASERAELDPAISLVERRLEAVRQALTPLEHQSPELAANIERLNQLHLELAESFRSQTLDHQKRLNAVEAAVKALDEGLTSHKQVVASGTRLLIRALRARSARADFLIPNDEITMTVGKRLMRPEGYSDGAEWIEDYRIWNEAVRTVDNLMLQWTDAEGTTGYTSLFDLKGHHYERAPMPPENVRSDDTIIPFKTVCHVQSSYANQRDGIFAYFQEKSAFPG